MNVATVVRKYRDWVTSGPPETLRVIVGPLRGHDLACWCPLDQPCHADVLLELANIERQSHRTGVKA